MERIHTNSTEVASGGSNADENFIKVYQDESNPVQFRNRIEKDLLERFNELVFRINSSNLSPEANEIECDEELAKVSLVNVRYEESKIAATIYTSDIFNSVSYRSGSSFRLGNLKMTAPKRAVFQSRCRSTYPFSENDKQTLIDIKNLCERIYSGE